MRAKRKPNKKILGVALVVHLSALALTWRDLGQRRDDEVHGDRRVWRVASSLNTLGSAAYWLFGRRPT